MAVNFTPIVNSADADADTFNTPLSELDDAIENVVDGDKDLTSPTILSFENAVHDHSSDAEGGKIGLNALDSTGEPAGRLAVTDGSGGFEFGAGPGLPTGGLIPFAGSTAPSGWLLCAGQAVSRTTYADLFAVISTTYGAGDGSTTFNVPDLRGRFPLGKDDMGGSAANRVTATEADNLGQGSGAETHTLTVNEIPSHNHPLTFQGGGGGYTVSSGQLGGTTTNSGNRGGDQAHNNMPPYITLNYIIKT